MPDWILVTITLIVLTAVVIKELQGWLSSHRIVKFFLHRRMAAVYANTLRAIVKQIATMLLLADKPRYTHVLLEGLRIVALRRALFPAGEAITDVLLAFVRHFLDAQYQALLQCHDRIALLQQEIHRKHELHKAILADHMSWKHDGINPQRTALLTGIQKWQSRSVRRMAIGGGQMLMREYGLRSVALLAAAGEMVVLSAAMISRAKDPGTLSAVSGWTAGFMAMLLLTLCIHRGYFDKEPGRTHETSPTMPARTKLLPPFLQENRAAHYGQRWWRYGAALASLCVAWLRQDVTATGQGSDFAVFQLTVLGVPALAYFGCVYWQKANAVGILRHRLKEEREQAERQLALAELERNMHFAPAEQKRRETQERQQWTRRYQQECSKLQNDIDSLLSKSIAQALCSPIVTKLIDDTASRIADMEN